MMLIFDKIKLLQIKSINANELSHLESEILKLKHYYFDAA